MKKLISIISIILAMCLMVSCGNVNETVTSVTSSTSVTEITTQTTLQTVSTTGNGGGGGCAILLSFYTYDEYKEYMDTHSLPADFVRYESLSQIGEFYAFVNLDDYDDIEHTEKYMYSFTDSNDFIVSISFEKIDSSKISTEEYIFLSEKPVDYRKLSSYQKGIVNVDGMKYWYINGELSSIELIYGDTEIIISGTGMLDDYPVNDEDTFMSRLLSPATAKAAAAELVTALTK